MIVISHRGYWRDPAEKNTAGAFERSFSLGFGVETDLRDRDGELVISHDMPKASALPAETFFQIYQRSGCKARLALNIKSDGLQTALSELLQKYRIDSSFVFDMAVPDGLHYCRQGFSTYTRQSEYEPAPAFYDLADGVWLDEFNGHWLTDEVITSHLDRGKQVCLVSPELHRRDHHLEWAHYRTLERRIGRHALMLCTDFPTEAQEFFNA